MLVCILRSSSRTRSSSTLQRTHGTRRRRSHKLRTPRRERREPRRTASTWIARASFKLWRPPLRCRSTIQRPTRGEVSLARTLGRVTTQSGRARLLDEVSRHAHENARVGHDSKGLRTRPEASSTMTALRASSRLRDVASKSVGTAGATIRFVALDAHLGRELDGAGTRPVEGDFDAHRDRVHFANDRAKASLRSEGLAVGDRREPPSRKESPSTRATSRSAASLSRTFALCRACCRLDQRTREDTEGDEERHGDQENDGVRQVHRLRSFVMRAATRAPSRGDRGRRHPRGVARATASPTRAECLEARHPPHRCRSHRLMRPPRHPTAWDTTG